MTSSATADSLSTARVPHRSPFLNWPVARREFYQSIMIALILPLLWGISLFGLHALLIVVVTVLAAVILHVAVARLTSRSAWMPINYTIVSAMLLAALTPESCPVWLSAVAGVVMTGLICLAGPPGRQRVHTGLLIALLLGLAVGQIQTGPVLVRDAMLMGNLNRSSPLGHYQWPRRAATAGADAVTLPMPDHVLAKTLRVISDRPAGRKARRELDNAFGALLPPPPELFLGAIPGRVGVVGVLGILIAGLVLAYRNILNPAAWGTFIVFVLLGFLFGPLSAHSLHHEFWQSLGGIWYLPPERAIYLLYVELCTGDFLFASVFLLAMPGTLPLNPRARWVFLFISGLLAALFARIALPLPPATTAILMMQPLSPWFDTVFPRRSWLIHQRSPGG